jgi:hypothetical protein
VPGLPKVMLHLSAVAISFGHGAGNYKFKWSYQTLPKAAICVTSSELIEFVSILQIYISGVTKSQLHISICKFMCSDKFAILDKICPKIGDKFNPRVAVKRIKCLRGGNVWLGRGIE